MTAEKLKYKGHTGTIEFSEGDNCLYGKIEMIDALVNYEADSLENLKHEFEMAVDDYLSDCNAVGGTKK